MKYFLTLLAFLTSSFNSLTKQIEPNLKNVPNVPIPSIIPVTTVTPKMFSYPTGSILPKPTLMPTIIPTAFPTSAPTSPPNISLNDYIYPGAQIVSSAGTTINLTSTDDSNSIVSWYKNKISGNFSSKSESISNANGNVSALLGASSSSQSITITIQKSATESNTNIQVEIKSQ
jgi:hypothetical protein